MNTAILESGTRRFRPVLLTSLTTIAGLLPILTEQSFQAQMVIPMAVSLCFGLPLAALLVPTFYSIYGSIVGDRIAQDAQTEKSDSSYPRKDQLTRQHPFIPAAE
ncbi:MAG: efflux RND transporter permease subunit [Fuerstiella sp.]|nr:efflux RND transporter permease subunit [Fuerstiella sp.]